MAKNRNAKHTADAGLVKESAAHKPLGRYNFMGMAFFKKRQFQPVANERFANYTESKTREAKVIKNSSGS